MALALPATSNLNNRHVFVAFNFEANYGLPANDSFSLQQLNAHYTRRSVGGGDGSDIMLQKQQDNINKTDGNGSGNTLDKKKRRKRNKNSSNIEKNGMFTRKRLYKVLERELFK